MAPYFNTAIPQHLALIPRPLRAHEDLTTQAELAEADVIGQYTRRVDADRVRHFTASQEAISAPGAFALRPGTFVFLADFNPDPGLATDPDLVIALRRVIADVTTWRLYKAGENPALGTVSTSAGGMRTKAANFQGRFPPDWDTGLQRWDIRPPVYAT